MVVKAYVLVQAQLGRSRTVAKAIAKVRGVKMVHAVTGVYDVIAYLEAIEHDVPIGTCHTKDSICEGC